MDFPDIDYGRAHPEYGAVIGNRQVLWSDSYVITTELHENGRLERIIDLGIFNFKNDILSQSGSTWDYRAEFTYRPEVRFLKWGNPPYIDRGHGLESNYELVTEEVESGLIYRYETDVAYPQWDPENNREIQISYSSSCNYDASSNRTECQIYKNLDDIVTTSERNVIQETLGQYLAPRWWKTMEPSQTLNRSEEEVQESKILTLSKPNKFKKKSADKITNFNPSTDTLEIDIDSSASAAHLLPLARARKDQEEACQAKISTSFMTRRRAAFTSTEMAQTKALAMGESLPFSKALLI